MSKRSAGLGIVVLFLIPFCLVGVGTGIVAVSHGIRHQWREAAVLGAFALCFGGVGFGLLAATLVARRGEAFADRMRERHPEEPWLWRQDWAAHRVLDSSKVGMITAWAFAIFWNAISSVVGAIALRQALATHEPKLLFVLLFPLIGLGLLVWAIRATSRYLKFGTSVLELAGVPAPIGRLLAGVVHANSYMTPDAGFRLVLSCINRRVTGSGKNRSTSESVLWQEERNIPRAIAGARGGDIPFVIPIASDTRATDDSNPSNTILWRLEISAAVPGVDYDATFEVPVYQTAESSQPLSAEELARVDPAGAIEDYHQPPGSPIAVTETATGLEIYFPPARNLGAGLGILAFTVIWFGVVAILIVTHAPFFLPLIFALAGLLPLYGLYTTLLLSTRIKAERGQLTSASRVAGVMEVGESAWNANEVVNLGVDIGMRSGSSVYYDLAVTDKVGKKRLLGRTIPSKREAEWLTARIKTALGVEEGPPQLGTR